MEWFIEDLDDADFADRLARAISGRGAFRRFKDTLFDRPDLMTRWYAFSNDRQRGRARSWLAAEGSSRRTAHYDEEPPGRHVASFVTDGKPDRSLPRSSWLSGPHPDYFLVPAESVSSLVAAGLMPCMDDTFTFAAAGVSCVPKGGELSCKAPRVRTVRNRPSPSPLSVTAWVILNKRCEGMLFSPLASAELFWSSLRSYSTVSCVCLALK